MKTKDYYFTPLCMFSAGLGLCMYT